MNILDAFDCIELSEASILSTLSPKVHRWSVENCIRKQRSITGLKATWIAMQSRIKRCDSLQQIELVTIKDQAKVWIEGGCVDEKKEAGESNFDRIRNRYEETPQGAVSKEVVGDSRPVEQVRVREGWSEKDYFWEAQRLALKSKPRSGKRKSLGM